jgi:hypothetical protein
MGRGTEELIFQTSAGADAPADVFRFAPKSPGREGTGASLETGENVAQNVAISGKVW